MPPALNVDGPVIGSWPMYPCSRMILGDFFVGDEEVDGRCRACLSVERIAFFEVQATAVYFGKKNDRGIGWHRDRAGHVAVCAGAVVGERDADRACAFVCGEDGREAHELVAVCRILNAGAGE